MVVGGGGGGGGAINGGLRCGMLQLFVLFSSVAPKFTVPQDQLRRKLFAAPVGSSIKLDCSADGHPRPTVRWYKDRALFKERKGDSRLYLSPWTTVLSLRGLVPADSGIYTCNVSKPYGWINPMIRTEWMFMVRARFFVIW